jgi:ribosome-associated heat shock protein Hsp15
MSFRLDKYIWSVRLAKTRSKATELVNKGKVRLNNAHAKPAKEVRLGDEIQVTKNAATFTFRIINLLDRRVGAKLVSDYIINVTPQDELDKYEVYLTNQLAYRDLGEGKPSKKQRRDLDDFLENWD